MSRVMEVVMYCKVCRDYRRVTRVIISTEEAEYFEVLKPIRVVLECGHVYELVPAYWIAVKELE